MRSKLAVYDLRTNLRALPREVDTHRPDFAWRLRSAGRGDDQAERRIIVRALAPTGAARVVWDSGWRATDRVRAHYQGEPLASFTSYEWELSVRWALGGLSFGRAQFETGALEAEAWQAAWIGRNRERITSMAPAGVLFQRPRAMMMAEAALRVRRQFEVAQPVLRARLFTSAHGVYRALLNGERVGDDELSPGWTDYRHRVQYLGHDVTERVSPGANVLGMVVGDGWWSGCVGYDARRHACHYGSRPHAFAQLVLDLADGSRQVIGTDQSWVERPGEIVYSDLLMGEGHDLTLAEPGWCTPGARLDGWQPAVVVSGDTVTLIGQRDEPLGVVATLPGRVLDATPERALIDFGQNLVGRVRIRIEGTQAGRPIRIRHAEVLDAGELSVANLRSAEATDTVVPASEHTEFEPWFTFHGFRYCELSGLPKGARITAIEAVAVSSRLPEAGDITTSSSLVNQLVSNIRWSLRGNFVSIPTDCPQRDERLGWTADAQVFLPTACYLADVEAFFGRWLLDLADNQLPSGSVPDVIPLPPPVEIFDTGAPGWGDAVTIIPWQLYRTYGDVDQLARLYPAMVSWVDYVSSRNPGGLWEQGLGNNYGDWLSVDETTDPVLVATAYRARSADLTSRVATVLGRREDAARFAALAERVRSAFVEEFVIDGRLVAESQSGYLFAVAWRLVPDKLRSAFGRRLVELIRSRGSRLTTGFLGVGLLCPTLTELGEIQLAHDLLLQTEYPSWGYSIKNGATTIWERWDAWTEHAGFQSPSMNSFNHYSLGSVGEWIFGTVGGIGQEADSIGFEHLVLQPAFDPRLDSCSASHQTTRGRVAVDWRRDRDGITLELEIPPGPSARLVLPGGEQLVPSGVHHVRVPGGPPMS